MKAATLLARVHAILEKLSAAACVSAAASAGKVTTRMMMTIDYFKLAKAT
jgi:hypothetical protein